MTTEQTLTYPFRLRDLLFTRIDFARLPEVPDPINFQLTAQVRVLAERYPEHFQIDLKVETVGDEPASFSLELVGLFDLVEGQEPPGRQTLSDFVNERALHMMSPVITQTVRQLTAIMGMAPLQVPIPYFYGFELQPDAEEE